MYSTAADRAGGPATKHNFLSTKYGLSTFHRCRSGRGSCYEALVGHIVRQALDSTAADRAGGPATGAHLVSTPGGSQHKQTPMGPPRSCYRRQPNIGIAYFSTNRRRWVRPGPAT